MESKKIKKLVLKKETISVLNDNEQLKHRGGGDTGYLPCLDYTGGCAIERNTYAYENTCMLCSGKCLEIKKPTPSGLGVEFSCGIC